MKNLILCGGVGSRLWPLSRTYMPKQFYPLINGKSLFEKTVLRNQKSCDSVLLATNKDQLDLARDQLLTYNIDIEGGVLEPCGRNTAPAIALTCLGLDKDDVVLVSPSDHLISDEVEYNRVLNRAKELAQDGHLVTFGITPNYPETGFGYIEAKDEDVTSFKEKPTIDVAKEYIEKGNYYWNSGMFCFKAGVFLEELEKYSPKVYLTCVDVYNNCDKSMVEPSYDSMMNIPSISIDYAVMEQSDKVKVVPSDIGWSDLGSFDSLYKELYNPAKENALLGSEDSILLSSTNNLIIGNKRKISCVDVEDLLIVDSEDALLIAKRGSSQKVKEVVGKLKEEDSSLLVSPVTVKRPWGSYTVLQDTPSFKVKRLEVSPGKKLSLQLHKKRQEHWTIVEGLAGVTIGEKLHKLSRNETAYIPAGEKHRLENIGQKKLVIIETQIGSYFGEDDIIRFKDDWGRA